VDVKIYEHNNNKFANWFIVECINTIRLIYAAAVWVFLPFVLPLNQLGVSEFMHWRSNQWAKAIRPGIERRALGAHFGMGWCTTNVLLQSQTHTLTLVHKPFIIKESGRQVSWARDNATAGNHWQQATQINY